MQLIQEKVNGTVQGALITVEHTEAQYSLGDGILLQVDGRLTLPKEVRCLQSASVLVCVATSWARLLPPAALAAACLPACIHTD
jgi:hypothetical protein